MYVLLHCGFFRPYCTGCLYHTRAVRHRLPALDYKSEEWRTAFPLLRLYVTQSEDCVVERTKNELSWKVGCWVQLY